MIGLLCFVLARFGCAAHPRRNAQARVSGRAVERRQVHGENTGATQPGMADLLAQPRTGIDAMDFFVVSTIGFDLLHAFVIVRIDRRDLVWVNVT